MFWWRIWRLWKKGSENKGVNLNDIDTVTQDIKKKRVSKLWIRGNANPLKRLVVVELIFLWILFICLWKDWLPSDWIYFFSGFVLGPLYLSIWNIDARFCIVSLNTLRLHHDLRPRKKLWRHVLLEFCFAEIVLSCFEVNEELLRAWRKPEDSTSGRVTIGF